MSKINVIEKHKTFFFVTGLLFLWVLIIMGCTYQLLAYDYTPGKDKNLPTAWVNSIGLKLEPDGYTLLMLVHPKCSCSRASIGELAKLAARFPKLLHPKILFVTPSEMGSEWKETENWIAASEIPGVEMIRDIDGERARKLSVRTSGFTLLYNHTGKMIFSGGITAARGHWGDNAGTQAISDLVSGKSPETKSTAAFGCNLSKK